MHGANDVNPFLRSDSSIRSLNRARIAALPGVSVDPGIIGKTGYELVSAQALRQELTRRAAALNLVGVAPDLLLHFERCFHQSDTQSLAGQIANNYGRKLGYLLLMLKRADPENRAARPEWNAAHWQFWQGIKTIVVGGGMLAGQLGSHALPAAQDVLNGHGFAEVTITRSAYAAHLPLVGLARTASHQAETMLLFDFGQTLIKRAVARYHQHEVIALHLLPAVPSVCRDLSATERSLEAIQGQWEQMLAIIVDTWRQIVSAWGQTPSIGISLACYLIDGHPFPGNHGCYGSLQVLSSHLETFVRSQITNFLQMDIRVDISHDGTAAALVYAGQPQCVVLTLGTAIGNGFPPPTDGYQPLASEFQVMSFE